MNNQPSEIREPAEYLLNCIMKTKEAGNWKIIEKIQTNKASKKDSQTGGNFSIGYIAEQDGQRAYLKAMKLEKTLRSSDIMAELRIFFNVFEYEYALLDKCKKETLSNVIMPIAKGQHKIEPSPDIPYTPYAVPYIIFEHTPEGDIRNKIDNFDLAFILRSLHNTAVGLEQLHNIKIAHQDIKPSNILVFPHNTCKIADLGRAIDKDGHNSNITKYKIPCDRTYAPFELEYQNTYLLEEFEKRFLLDMYLLGSLIFCYFLKQSLTSIMTTYLKTKKILIDTNDFYEADLPFFQEAFNYALELLEKRA